jgi:uncharacterized protein YutE (UPF0331/DUF86 family)
MSRKEDFIQAGIDYRMEHGKPMAIGGDNFADVANEMNRCKDYEAGAEYGYQYAIDKVCDILNHYCNRTGVHPSRRVDIINHIRKEM